jgi:hypothetical protein
MTSVYEIGRNELLQPILPLQIYKSSLYWPHVITALEG